MCFLPLLPNWGFVIWQYVDIIKWGNGCKQVTGRLQVLECCFWKTLQRKNKKGTQKCADPVTIICCCACALETIFFCGKCHHFYDGNKYTVIHFKYEWKIFICNLSRMSKKILKHKYPLLGDLHIYGSKGFRYKEHVLIFFFILY